MLANVLRSQCKLTVSLCRTSVSLYVASHALSRRAAHPVLVNNSTVSSTISSRNLHGSLSKATDTLYVYNIPWKTGADNLSKVFSQFGAVKYVRLGMDNGRSRGIAFVRFEDINDAVRAYTALTTQPVNLGDRKLKVEYSYNPRRAEKPNESDLTLYVRRLADESNEEDLTSVFSRFGEVKNVRVEREFDGSPKGHAWVTFQHPKGLDMVSKYLKDNQISLHGNPLRVSYNRGVELAPEVPRQRGISMKSQGSISEPTNMLSVGNLRWNTRAEELKDFFSQFGALQWIERLRSGHDGRPRGVALVRFEEVEDAVKAHTAVTTHFVTLGGRELTARYSSLLPPPKEPNEPNRTLFVARLAHETNEEDLVLLFSQFGEVSNTKVVRAFDGSPRGHAWVTFRHLEDAKTVREYVKHSHILLRGQTLLITYNVDLKPSGDEIPNRELVIGNLPPEIQETEIEKFLSAFAAVRRVTIPLQPDGSPFGYAFVEFKDLEDAVKIRNSAKAASFNIGGRKVEIKYRVFDEESNSLLITDTQPIHKTNLMDIFRDFRIGHNNIYVRLENRHSKEFQAYVNFDSNESASKALERGLADKPDSMRIKFVRKNKKI